MEKKYSALLISLGSTSSKWVAEAMRNHFLTVDEIDIRSIKVVLTKEGPRVYSSRKIITGYDCVYAKGSFRYESLLRAISTVLSKESYMPLAPSTFTYANNKLITYLELAKAGISIPTTYVVPNIDAAKKILGEVNYPIIMKFPSGTQGKGVMFADTYASASSILDALTALRQPFIIQEYVETKGEDIRLIVVGDKVVAMMKRKAKIDEVRSNLHSGGSCCSFEADAKTKAIAVKAAKSINAQVAGVDILLSKKEPLVLEINASPGLQGITKATNLNVAGMIASYLFDATSEFKHKEKEEKRIVETSEEKKGEYEQSIMQTLTLKDEKILLPKLVTQLTKFSDGDEVVIQASKKNIKIKKL